MFWLDNIRNRVGIGNKTAYSKILQLWTNVAPWISRCVTYVWNVGIFYLFIYFLIQLWDLSISLPFRETSSSTSCMKLAISGGSLWISLSLRPSFLNFTSWKNCCEIRRITIRQNTFLNTQDSASFCCFQTWVSVKVLSKTSQTIQNKHMWQKRN